MKRLIQMILNYFIDNLGHNDGIAKAQGTIDIMNSGRAKNGSYYRRFTIRYSENYRDRSTGEIVFVNMSQNVIGWNEVARHIKAEFGNGDTVLVIGKLKSRETEYATERFIEIESVDHIERIQNEARQADTGA